MGAIGHLGKWRALKFTPDITSDHWTPKPTCGHQKNEKRSWGSLLNMEQPHGLIPLRIHEEQVFYCSPRRISETAPLWPALPPLEVSSLSKFKVQALFCTPGNKKEGRRQRCQLVSPKQLWDQLSFMKEKGTLIGVSKYKSNSPYLLPYCLIIRLSCPNIPRPLGWQIPCGYFGL